MIEVIVGSMFSGKTEELIRRLRRAVLGKQAVQIFKPSLDNRYSTTEIASHDQTVLPSEIIERAVDIFRLIRPETQVVGIDEGQFFDDELVDVVEELADRGLRVIVAGLDVDWRGEPFPPMPAIMAVAEHVLKLHAVCMVCGSEASRTQRLVRKSDQVLVGSHGLYEPRCRKCFDLGLAMEARSLVAPTPFEYSDI